MKNRLLFLLSILFGSILVSAQTIQSGTPDCTQIRIPVSTNSMYTYSQQIICKEKFTNAANWSDSLGPITRIRYYISNANFMGLTNSNMWNIYIGTTVKNQFDSINDWIDIDSLSLVYSGQVVAPNDSGWWDIILQTPFQYDGLKNIVIAVDENTALYAPYHTYWLSNMDSVNRGIFFQSQGGPIINPDPISPPAGSLSMANPVIQFYFQEECSAPSNFLVDSILANEAFVSWVPQIDSIQWNLRYRRIEDNSWSEINNISGINQEIQNLFSVQSYVAQVQSNCILKNSEWSNPVFFKTTAKAGMEYTVDWEVFKNISSGTFSQVDSLQPDFIIKLDSIHTQNYSTGMDRFFSQIRGYILPRVSGLYSFHFGCDDKGEFWLSPDDDEAHAVMAIKHDSAQTNLLLNSTSQYLVAGEQYFFKILHQDSVYTDMIQLCWTMPGDTIMKTIKKPFISTCGTNIVSSGLHCLNNNLNYFPGSSHQIQYRFLPWNTSDKRIIWQSTDSSVAVANSSGVISMINAGYCQIIGKMMDNPNVADTIQVHVWNSHGPFFVKPDAPITGSGTSWNDPIDLQTLLNILNTRVDNDIITIFLSEGIYKPTETIDRNISFNLLNVNVLGGYSSLSQNTDTSQRDYQQFQTVLSGEIGDQSVTYDNSYHVITTMDNNHYWGWSLPNKYTMIEGVTISDGRASCSTYGVHGTFSINDNGGGIFIKGSKVQLVNCRIFNNSAWSRAGGIFTQGGNHVTSELLIQNTSFDSNLIQQITFQPDGSIFEVIINGYGPAMVIASCTYNISNCLFFNNHGYSRTIALEHSSGKIENCSFFNNTVSGDDIFVESSSLLNLINSTIERKIWVFTNSRVNVKNSTVGVLGGGGSVLNVNSINCDNSIVKVLYNSLTDPLVSAKYSILGNTLVGSDKSIILSDSIPNSSLWLDTLAFNGGPTPTMRLKNVPFNPAKSLGNPLYLDSLDQRGYLRKDSVSIGAYQWIRPDSISVTVASNLICQGDSAILEVTFSPPYVDDSTYSVLNLNDTIAFSDSAFVHVLSAGNAQIVVSSNDGNKSDTLLIDVIGTIGIGIISGDSIVCQGDGAVMYQVTPLENATSYVWVLPSGVSGNSSVNSIFVDYDLTATSGPISVAGQNVCFNGSEILFPVLVNEKPATPVISIQVDTLFSIAAYGNQWYDDNGAIAGANNPYYIVTENGSYYVVVSNDGCNSDPSNIISVTNVGLYENEVFMSIYPNPATTQITISGVEPSGTTLRLYDLTGKLLLERVNSDNTLDVSYVEAGSYLLEVRSDSGVVYGRVVVE